jgi:energy-coupling factor transport system permease protein
MTMLKDITLGQYLPGKSVVHRLDPRTKILLIMGLIIALFSSNNLVGYAVAAVFIGAVNKMAGITRKMVVKSIKPLMFFIIFTAVINLFLTDGEGKIWEFGIVKLTWEGIYLTLVMSLRLIFLVVGTSVLTYTTSPIVLTDGIEALMRPLTKIGVPAHEIAMMMTIALRFIPTIIDETDKIEKNIKKIITQDGE